MRRRKIEIECDRCLAPMVADEAKLRKAEHEKRKMLCPRCDAKRQQSLRGV